MLSSSQRAQYWEDGFLHPLDVMAPSEAESLRTALETLERDWLTADLPLPLANYKRVGSHCVMPLAYHCLLYTSDAADD